jgi:hypothetical protein
MVVETIPQFIFFALAVYGAAQLGHTFQRWVNS